MSHEPTDRGFIACVWLSQKYGTKGEKMSFSTQYGMRDFVCKIGMIPFFKEQGREKTEWEKRNWPVQLKLGVISQNKPCSLLEVDRRNSLITSVNCHNSAPLSILVKWKQESNFMRQEGLNTKCQKVTSLAEKTKQNKTTKHQQTLVIILAQSRSLFLPPVGLLHLWLSSELFRHNVRHRWRWKKLQVHQARKKNPQ